MAGASTLDRRVLRQAARKGKTAIVLPEDADWLRGIVKSPPAQLSRMSQRGLLERVGQGRYVVLPPGAASAAQLGSLPVLLTAALPSGDGHYYLGYWSALADHRLTDEEADAIYLAIRGKQAPTGLKTLAGLPVRVNRITADRKWFGAERLRAQGRTFYYRSDIERTLIDTLDRPRLCGRPEIWVRAWERGFREERVDGAKLVDYALQIGGNVALRTGFWLRELGRVRDARLVLRAVGAPLTGPRFLDASKAYGDGPWTRDRETGLYLNIPERSVVGWLEYGK